MNENLSLNNDSELTGPFYDYIQNSYSKNYAIMIMFYSLIITIILTIFINEMYWKYKELKNINDINNIIN